MGAQLETSTFYKELASIFRVDVSEIKPEVKLSTLTWDSLAVVSTILIIDEQFNVLAEGQALAQCQTIGGIEALIQKLQAE